MLGPHSREFLYVMKPLSSGCLAQRQGGASAVPMSISAIAGVWCRCQPFVDRWCFPDPTPVGITRFTDSPIAMLLYRRTELISVHAHSNGARPNDSSRRNSHGRQYRILAERRSRSEEIVSAPAIESSDTPMMPTGFNRFGRIWTCLHCRRRWHRRSQGINGEAHRD